MVVWNAPNPWTALIIAIAQIIQPNGTASNQTFVLILTFLENITSFKMWAIRKRFYRRFCHTVSCIDPNTHFTTCCIRYDIRTTYVTLTCNGYPPSLVFIAEEEARLT